MITLEDQIRRYATDVAGPAVGEPPADLLAFTRPRHRGRWVLVAALALFIAGLAYVATSSHDTSSPAVTTPETTAPRVVPPQVTSRLTDGDRCLVDQQTTVAQVERSAVVFGGPNGDGLCVRFEVAEAGAYSYSFEGPEVPDLALMSELLASVPQVEVPTLVTVADGNEGTHLMVSVCQASWVQEHPLGVISFGIGFATASPRTEFVRFDTDKGPLFAQAADVPGLDGLRVALIRIPSLSDQGLVEAHMTALDADLQPLEPSTSTTLTPGCNPLSSANSSPALVDDGIGDSHPLPTGG